MSETETLFENEYGNRKKMGCLWEIEMVVVHTLNDLVGEITKRSLNGDGEYDYMVDYEDGACEWCEDF